MAEAPTPTQQDTTTGEVRTPTSRISSISNDEGMSPIAVSHKTESAEHGGSSQLAGDSETTLAKDAAVPQTQVEHEIHVSLLDDTSSSTIVNTARMDVRRQSISKIAAGTTSVPLKSTHGESRTNSTGDLTDWFGTTRNIETSSRKGHPIDDVSEPSMDDGRTGSAPRLVEPDHPSKRNIPFELLIEYNISTILCSVQLLMLQTPKDWTSAESLVKEARSLVENFEEVIASKVLLARCDFWTGVIEVQKANMPAACRAFISARDCVDPQYVESHLLGLCYKKYWSNLMAHVDLTAEYNGQRDRVRNTIKIIARANETLDDSNNLESKLSVEGPERSQSMVANGNSPPPVSGSLPSPTNSVSVVAKRELVSKFIPIDDLLPLLIARDAARVRSSHVGGSDSTRDRHLIKNDTTFAKTSQWVAQGGNEGWRPSIIGSPLLDLIHRVSILSTTSNDPREEGGERTDIRPYTSPAEDTSVSQRSSLYNLLERLLDENITEEDRIRTNQQIEDLMSKRNSDGRLREEENMDFLERQSFLGSQFTSLRNNIDEIAQTETATNEISRPKDLSNEIEEQEKLQTHHLAGSSKTAEIFDGVKERSPSDKGGVPQPDELDFSNGSSLAIRIASRTDAFETDAVDPLVSSPIVTQKLHTELPENRSCSSSQNMSGTTGPDGESQSDERKGDLTDALAPEEIQHRVRTTIGKRLSLSIETAAFPDAVRSPPSPARSPWSSIGRRSTEPAIHSPLRAASASEDTSD